MHALLSPHEAMINLAVSSKVTLSFRSTLFLSSSSLSSSEHPLSSRSYQEWDIAVRLEKSEVQNPKFKVQSSKFKVQSSKFKVQSSKFKVQSSKVRHPIANHCHSIQDTNLLSPGEFLAMKENANSRRNMQVVGDMYARVMRALAEKEGKGESYPSLKEAPVERLPYLVEKFIQAARKSNMEVYASGTFHFIWNRVANILSSRETDPVNVKTDVNFRRAREILARSFLLLEY
jgi:hypothetical protein